LEMELQQVVLFLVDGQGTARLNVDLDGVAIVDDFQRTFLV